MARLRVQTRAATTWAFARFAFVYPFGFAFGRQLVFQNRFVIAVRSRLQILVPNFAEPAAFFTHPMRRIKREQTRIEFLKCAAAIRAAHLGAHDSKAIFGIEQTRCASTNLKRASGNLASTSDSP